MFKTIENEQGCFRRQLVCDLFGQRRRPVKDEAEALLHFGCAAVY